MEKFPRYREFYYLYCPTCQSELWSLQLVQLFILQIKVV